MPRRWVVRQHEELGASFDETYRRSFAYSYAGGRSDLRGRGWLGFSSRRIFDEYRIGYPRVFSYTDYTFKNVESDPATNSYPFVGIPWTEEHLVVTDENRVRRRSVYNTLSYEYPTEQRLTSFPHTKSSTNAIFEGEWAGGTSVGESLITGFVTDNKYDQFGNRWQFSTTWHDVNLQVLESQISTTEYMHRPESPHSQTYIDAWLVSVPEKRTVTSQMAPDTAEVTRTLKSEYYESGEACYMTGLPKKIIREPDATEYRLETGFLRDIYGNVQIWGAEGGGQERGGLIGYDLNGVFPSALMDANGHMTYIEYDPASGQPIASITELNQDDDTQTDLLQTFSVLDGFGRVVCDIAPDGTATETEYLWMATSTNGPGQPTTGTVFDTWARPTTLSFEGFEGDTVIQRVWYDELGRVSETTRPNTMALSENTPRTTYQYDLLDRVRRITLPDGNVVENCYWNRVTCTKDPKQYIGCRVVDHRGRVVKVVEPQPPEVVPPETSCLEMAVALDAVEQGEYPSMLYEYGPFGVLQRTVDAEDNEVGCWTEVYGRPRWVADPDLGQRMYGYTPFHDLKAYIDANGNTSLFEYDNLGRLVTRVDQDPGNDPDKDTFTTWEYDEGQQGDTRCGAYGSLCRTTSPEGDTVEYGYDQLARVESILRGVDGDSMSVYVDYNEHSQPSEVTYPQTPEDTTVKVKYNYKDTGYLESIRNASDAGQVYWQAESTNEFHQLDSELFAHGLRTTRQYNPERGLLTGLTTKAADGQSVDYQKLGYFYDDNGNLEIMGDQSDPEYRRYDGQMFGYDQLNRLTAVLRSVGGEFETETYEYSVIGNLVSKSITSASGDEALYAYAYDAARVHAAITMAGTDGLRFYRYNANGNMNERWGTQGTGMPYTQFEYTRFDKPSLITIDANSGSQQEIAFRYDAEQERVKKVGPNETTVYFPGLYYRTEDTSSGRTQHHYLISNDTRVVTEVVKEAGVDDRVLYHHDDYLGSTVLVTEETSEGDVIAVQSNGYGVYGEQDTQNESITKVGYTGHEYDAELGLVNMGGRMYDPQLGRMLTPDPFVANPWKPRNYNRYTYAFNNPLRFVDPTGFQVDCLPGEDCGGVVVVEQDPSGGGGSGGINWEKVGREIEQFFEDICFWCADDPPDEWNWKTTPPSADTPSGTQQDPSFNANQQTDSPLEGQITELSWDGMMPNRLLHEVRSDPRFDHWNEEFAHDILLAPFEVWSYLYNTGGLISAGRALLIRGSAINIVSRETGKAVIGGLDDISRMSLRNSGLSKMRQFVVKDAEHAWELNRQWLDTVIRAGDEVIVAGRNYGAGTIREIEYLVNAGYKEVFNRAGEIIKLIPGK